MQRLDPIMPITACAVYTRRLTYSKDVVRGLQLRDRRDVWDDMLMKRMIGNEEESGLTGAGSKGSQGYIFMTELMLLLRVFCLSTGGRQVRISVFSLNTQLYFFSRKNLFIRILTFGHLQ